MKKNKRIAAKNTKTADLKKFKSHIGVLPYMTGMHYIEIPAKIVKAFGSTYKIRLHCTVNQSLHFQCGLMALGEGRAYIMITKARLKQLNLRAGDKVEICLKRDKSKYGMKICGELTEVLKQDPDGAKRFAGLTPGKQRNIIHYVGSVKNSDKRIERALLIVGNLKNLP